MAKKDTNGILSLVCFVLFVVWAIATLLIACNVDLGSAQGFVENLMRICAFVALGYFAYCYYAPRKKSVPVAVLFWIALIVGVCAVIVPLFM